MRDSILNAIDAICGDITILGDVEANRKRTKPRAVLIVITYDDEHYPDSPETAQRQMQNFLRRVKYYRAKNGLPELKYVGVTETGKQNGRLHHHIVMSGGVDTTTLAEIWGRGFIAVNPLQFNDQGIVGVAKYLNKEPIKWWCVSRNLKAIRRLIYGKLLDYFTKKHHINGV